MVLGDKIPSHWPRLVIEATRAHRYILSVFVAVFFCDEVFHPLFFRRRIIQWLLESRSMALDVSVD